MHRRKLYFLIALSIATSLAVSSTALHADVVAHWAFDETTGTTAHDSVGGYDGTLQGEASWGPGGIAGGAISLDRGTNDLVNMGDVLPLWQAGDFSVAAWVRTTSADPETFVVAKHLSGQGAGYILGINTSGGFGAPGKAYFYNNWGSATSTTAVTDGQWHHLVGVHRAGGFKEIYVDGAPAEHSIPTCAAMPNTAPLLIGGLTYGGVPTGSYTGLIDDIQVYNHALTSEQIQFLFRNPGTPVRSLHVGLVAHWAFDEPNGSTAFDIVGGYDGTLQGDAAFVPTGVAGGAISLDRRTNDLVNIGDVLELTTTNLSIAAWVRTTSTEAETFIVARHTSGIPAGYILALNSSAGLWAPGRAWFWNRANCATSTTTVTDGAWHHIVAVQDLSLGFKRIYVDGSLEDSKPNIAIPPAAAPLLIGGLSYSGSATGSYTGLIDDVQIYDYALTPDEARFLFDHPGGPISSVPWVWPGRVENSGPWRLEVIAYTLELHEPPTMRLAPAGGGPEILGTHVALALGRLSGAFDLTGVAPGGYDLIITNSAGASETLLGAVTVLASQQPLIAAVEPAVLANTGSATLTLTGRHLNPFAQVKLSRLGSQDIVPQSVTGTPNGTLLTAQFALDHAAPGLWDVVVTNPNGDSATAHGAVTVVDALLYQWAEVTAGAQLVYDIDVPVGESRLFVTVQKVEQGWNGSVSLQRDAEVVASAQGSGDWLLQVLDPAPGSYTIEVNPSASGSAMLWARSSLAEVLPGELFLGTIYQNDGYDWAQTDVPAGVEKLDLTVETVGNVSYLDVWRGSFDSDEHWHAEQWFNPPVRLTIEAPQAGRYYLRVMDHGILSGPTQVRDYTILADMTFAIPPVSPADVEANGPWVLTLNAGPLLGGQPFVDGATVELVGPGGGRLVGQNVTIDPTGESLSAQFDFVGAPTGRYDLEWVNGDGTPGSLAEAIEVLPAQPPVITSVDPSTVGNTGYVTVTITGEHLNPFAEVKLSRSGWSDIVASEVTGSYDGTQLSATTDATGAPPGTWDLVVTNPNGDTTAAAGSIALVEGGAPDVWLEMVGPDVVRIGRLARYTVLFGNRGSADALGPLLELGVPDGWEIVAIEAKGQQLLDFPWTDSDVPFTLVLPVVRAGTEGRVDLIVKPGTTSTTARLVRPRAVPPQVWAALRAFIKSEGQRFLFHWLEEKSLRWDELRDITCPEDLRGWLLQVLKRAYLEWAYEVGDDFPAWAADKALTMLLAACEGKWGVLKTPELKQLVDDIRAARDGWSKLMESRSAWRAAYRNLRELREILGDLFSLPVSSKKGVVAVGSWDPNYKAGLAGFGQAHYVRPQRGGYVVHHENDAEKATAAAAEVHITDQLDPNLEWSTYEITGIQIGEVNVPVPDGSQTFSDTVPAVVPLKDWTDPDYPNVPPQDTNVNIEVNCQFDPATGLAQWHFVGRDPSTGELADFLPPNVWEDDPATTWDDNVAPHGEGWVSYACRPKDDLPSGTRIENIASIVFDVNEPMETNLVFNTIDPGTPTSQVDALATESPAEFTVTWNGDDEQNGSGIAGYDIWVSDNGAPYDLWLSATPDTSATYTGEDGHFYRFFSLARDNVGHVEAWPMDPDAETTVSWVAVSSPSLEPGCQYFFSIPVDPMEPSPGILLSPLGEPRTDWLLSDRLGTAYRLYPDERVRDFAPGRGYWLKTGKLGGAIEVEGWPVDPSQPFSTDVPDGWSIIGCPFMTAVPWDDDHVQVAVSGQTLPLTQAVIEGWLHPTIYGYADGGRFGIDLTTDTGSLEPWQGYEIHTRMPCTLTMTANAAVTSAASSAPARKPSPDDWQIPLVASVNGLIDRCTKIGIKGGELAGADVTTDGVALAEPHPPAGLGIDLYVNAASALSDDSPGLARALRNEPLTQATWDIAVATSQADAPVTVAWPDLAEMPKELIAYLVDTASGKRTYMRTRANYTYNSGEDSGTRQLRVEVKQRGEGTLLISGLTAAPTRGGTWDIAFNLSADAAVTGRVYNVAGRRIADIAQAQQLARGRASLVWDSRSIANTHVPSGVYLLRVTARTEEGEQASAVTMLQVWR